MSADLLLEGELAPDFELRDVHENVIRLSAYRGRPVVLALLRGFFCLYCRAQLENLRDSYSQFTQRGAEVLALGPDTAEAFKKHWDSENIPFIGLPDIDYRVARMYRQEVNMLKVGRMPLSLVIDPGGYIRYLHYGTSMMDIPDVSKLLHVIDAIKESSN